MSNQIWKIWNPLTDMIYRLALLPVIPKMLERKVADKLTKHTESYFDYSTWIQETPPLLLQISPNVRWLDANCLL